jgi:hypothetical protein
VRAEHLYRLRFTYSEYWSVGASGPMQQNFGLASGRCEGRVSGTFRGANHARIRPDNVYLPDLQGYITTEDGGEILVDIRGRGRIRDDGSFRATGTATHVSGDERYSFLNDGVCALEAGDVSDEETAIDVYELIWEPIAE